MSVISFGAPEKRTIGESQDEEWYPKDPLFIDVPILSQGDSEESLRITFDKSEDEPTRFIISGRGIDTVFERDEFFVMCDALIEKLVTRSINNYSPPEVDVSTHILPFNTEVSVFGTLWDTAKSQAKLLYHVAAKRPCETVVNLVITGLLCALVTYLPGILWRSNPWSNVVPQNLLCNGVFRNIELFGRKVTGASTTSTCTQYNQMVDFIIAELWGSFLSAVIPLTNIGTAGLNPLRDLRGGAAIVEAIKQLCQGAYDWKGIGKKVASFVAPEVLGPIMRQMSEYVCGHLGWSGTPIDQLAMKNVVEGSRVANARNRSRPVETIDSRTKQSAPQTRAAARPAQQQTSTGYPGPWRRGPGGEFREVARKTYRNRDDEPVSRDGFRV